MKQFTILLCLFFIIFSQLTLSATPETSEVEVTILHTNDHHGHLTPFDILGQKNVGGMAARMSFIKQVRQQVQKRRGHVLILDSGDVNTGEPASDMLMGEPDIKIMNLMGYQAMAIGNHEFDLTMENLRKQQQWANFPFLSANIFYQNGKPAFRPYIIFRYGDLRIAVFAITTPDTPVVSTYGNNPKLKFVEPLKVIPSLVKDLHSKADFIIGMFHMAHPDVIELIQKTSGIDMVIGGHTHLPTMKPIKVNNTLVVEAGSYGLMMGRCDLVFKKRKLVNYKYQLVGINLSEPILNENGEELCIPYKQKFADDPQVNKFLKPYLKRTEKLLNRKIGSAKQDISKGLTGPSSPLGNLIADAIKKYSKADIALQNIGGIRADLLKGDITYRDVRCILPFANTIVVFKITGQQLLELLSVMSTKGREDGGIFEIAGMTMTIEQQQLKNIKIAGKPLQKTKIYSVAINSFIAGGGDNYPIFKTFKNKTDTGFYLSTVLLNYIKKYSPIQADTSQRLIWKR